MKLDTLPKSDIHIQEPKSIACSAHGVHKRNEQYAQKAGGGGGGSTISCVNKAEFSDIHMHAQLLSKKMDNKLIYSEKGHFHANHSSKNK